MYETSVIIQNIDFACKDKGVSINRALIESGAGAQMINNMRAGSKPSMESFAQLAEYLNVSIDRLIGTGIENEMTGFASEQDIEKQIKQVLIEKGVMSENEPMPLDKAKKLLDYVDSVLETFKKFTDY